MTLCPSCSVSIPAGARFCPSCGTAVLGQPEERRIVTVVFADIVGFTTLSEHLDPEQVKRIIDGCFEHLVDVVAEFGGRVDKVMGDGMLVLFGAPIAHEDDPERAVRAALRMHTVLAERAAQVPGVSADGLKLRIGINTGEVLVGSLAGGDYTAMGDVVNTAARLQVAAPPGGVLVGSNTYGLTSHTFEYESVGTLQPRGREQAVQAWIALQPTAPPGARRRRHDVPLVGRDIELSLAEQTIAITTMAHRGSLLHVVGEGGVGKTRLVDEVVRRLRDDAEATVLDGACVPYGEANVWFPIAQALLAHLELDPNAPLDAVREAAQQGSLDVLDDLPTAERNRIVDVFAHLLGHPSPLDRLDPATARGAIHHAVRTVLEHRAARGPIVLAIDDLHWADSDLLELLAHLVDALARHQFALITASRPNAEVEWPPRSERCTASTITLEPLTRAETERLARELLDGTPADEPMLAALYDRSGGNPLFLIELVALTDTDGAPRELPDSLRTLIAARLDQLTTEQRQVIENAAILGTSGRIAGLERFADGIGQSFDIRTVHELDELGLFEVLGARWEFRSDSVRDAAYQTLTKAARAIRHAAVAAALGQSSVTLDDRAHHAASAAELVSELGPVAGVPSDITTNAVALLTAAAERSLEVGSLSAAVRSATRALELIDRTRADDRTLARLLAVRAAAGVERRDIAAASDDLDRLHRLAGRLADTGLDAESHRLRGMLANHAGRVDEARIELGTAIDLLRRAERPDLLARTLRLRGFIEMFGGSLTDAEWFFGEADELYRSLDDERGMAYIEQHRAWIAFLSGDLEPARQRLTQAASTLGLLGDRNGVGWAFGLLAWVEFFEGHYDRAEAHARSVRTEAEQRGDRWAVAMMDTLLAQLALWRGEIPAAADLAERARSEFKRLNDRYGLSQALIPLLRCQVALGRDGAAERTAAALALAAAEGHNGPLPLQALAGAAMHQGDGASALSMAEQAQAAVEAAGTQSNEPRIIAAVARAQLGDIAAARATIEQVPRSAGGSPFLDAAAALILASSGDHRAALERAEAVRTASGATYLDDVFAELGAASAHWANGHRDVAMTAADDATRRASSANDVVATAVAAEVFERIAGQPHDARDDRHTLPDGWRMIVAFLVPRPPTN